MIYALYILEVVVCIFLILVVLLQQGSGADLSVFGGGGTQTAFGARGTTQLIHKLTVWSFIAFIFLTLAIAVFQRGPEGGSVMSGVEAGTSETAGPEAPAPAAGEMPASGGEAGASESEAAGGGAAASLGLEAEEAGTGGEPAEASPEAPAGEGDDDDTEGGGGS